MTALLDRLESIRADFRQINDIMKNLEDALNRQGTASPDNLYPMLNQVDKDLVRLAKDIQRVDESHQRYKHALKLIDLVSDDLPQTYQSILESVCEMMNAETGIIIAHNPNTDSWERCYGYHDDRLLELSILKENLFKQMATLEDVVTTVNSLLGDLPVGALPPRYGIRSFLLFPLIVDDVHICSVSLDCHMKKKFFQSHDVEFIQNILPIIAQVIRLSQTLSKNTKS